MFTFSSLQKLGRVRTKWQHMNWELNMDNIFAAHRKDRAAEARRLETKEAIKDAIGVFAIITMLYVGLFIPSL